MNIASTIENLRAEGLTPYGTPMCNGVAKTPAEKTAERNALRIAAGLCTRCDGALVSETMCLKHLIYCQMSDQRRTLHSLSLEVSAAGEDDWRALMADVEAVAYRLTEIVDRAQAVRQAS